MIIEKKAGVTGELKNAIDKIWDDMFSYGMANPLVVIEQLTYLMFIRLLDMNEEINEKRDLMIKGVKTDKIFPETTQGQMLRWSKFKSLPANDLHELIRDRVFPFIKGISTVVEENGNKITIPGLKISKKSSYLKHMENATYDIQKPVLTEKVVTAIDRLSDTLKNADLKGDLYEYMLSKLSTAKQLGQFRTPRHIIDMMVRMLAPKLTDTIIDPACGTGGFLVGAGKYIQEKNERTLRLDKKLYKHYQSEMFTGYDTDNSMLRISAMNTILHNMDEARIENKNSLSDSTTDIENYSVVLANPPFKGSLDHDDIAPTLTTMASTKKTELLFIALFIRLLEYGGRCACIVPDGVLFGTSNAHRDIRKELIENHHLRAVISMPSGVFKPYAGVSTAILIFTKTGKGGTDKVWFYDMKADGFSLDDKRAEIKDNDIPDILERWENLEAENVRTRIEQSFFVSKNEIVENVYDLSINKYKKTETIKIEYPPTKEIMASLYDIEERIAEGLKELEAMLDED